MLENSAIAELLTIEAETATGHRELAFRRAAHEAFMWPEEAHSVAASGRSLTDLPGIGPSISSRLQEWLEHPPELKPPPARQEFLTLAKARRVLAKHPEYLGHLNGDLQMHTQWSDGSATIATMAAAAIDRGYRYIAITDHTKGLKIAGGLDEKRLRQQGREIAKLNETFRKEHFDFHILASAELNLSPAGEGDVDTATLARLDLVLGCFHSSLRHADDQTNRYIAGLQNPDVQILGHPQTRVYDRREGMHADWARVFAEAARLDKAVEIDGYADRQDLRVSLLKIARKEGVRISLGTDAHHPEQLAYMELGLAAACLAKIAPERIVNFLPAKKLKSWVSSLRRSAQRSRASSS